MGPCNFQTSIMLHMTLELHPSCPLLHLSGMCLDLVNNAGDTLMDQVALQR